MLVVTRREGEKVIILVNGIEISVSIGEARHGKAAVAVEAPWHVGVWRDEVLSRFKDEPAHIAHPSLTYQTMCGKTWKRGDGVISVGLADGLGPYVCKTCRIMREDRLEDDYEAAGDDE